MRAGLGAGPGGRECDYRSRLHILTVMHYHVHLLPRTQGESMRLHGSNQADPTRLDALARAFAARLKELHPQQ